MNAVHRFIVSLVRSTFERYARGKDAAALAADLDRSGATLVVKARRAADSPQNREVRAHWIGIERWGCSRIRVALGEPFIGGGYRGFRPEEGLTKDVLVATFESTRADTVALARHLSDASTDLTTTVEHDGLGPLTVARWLCYLVRHPEFEARTRLRG